MVKKELQGKDQASCQDFKKNNNRVKVFIEESSAAHNFDELGIST